MCKYEASLGVKIVSSLFRLIDVKVVKCIKCYIVCADGSTGCVPRESRDTGVV